LIRSKKSRLPSNAGVKSFTIKDSLFREGDDDFINFIEVSAFLLLTISIELLDNRPLKKNDPRTGPKTPVD